jgi:hypothetical protein
VNYRRNFHACCVVLQIGTIAYNPHSTLVPIFAAFALWGALAFLAESRRVTP